MSEMRAGMTHVLKKDGTIVTTVDRAIEMFLREKLLALTPGAGFWGEEFGFAPPTVEGQWVLDPIDGTSNFTYGSPLWGVTGAFLYKNELQIGINLLPDLGWEILAAREHGATFNGVKLPPIPPGEILPYELVSHGDGKRASMIQSPGKMRHVGSIVVEGCMVAQQQLRALTTGKIMLYDCAGSILVCRELGAQICTVTGDPWHESDHCNAFRKSPPLFIGPSGSNFPFSHQAQA